VIVYWGLLGIVTMLVTLTANASVAPITGISSGIGQAAALVVFVAHAPLLADLVGFMAIVLSIKFVIWVLTKLHLLGGA
jgi:hypothetical protein